MDNRSSFDIYDTNETLNSLIDTMNSIVRSYNSNMTTLINGYNNNTRLMLTLIENLISSIGDLNNNLDRNSTYRRNVSPPRYNTRSYRRNSTPPRRSITPPRRNITPPRYTSSRRSSIISTRPRIVPPLPIRQTEDYRADAKNEEEYSMENDSKNINRQDLDVTITNASENVEEPLTDDDENPYSSLAGTDSQIISPTNNNSSPITRSEIRPLNRYSSTPSRSILRRAVESSSNRTEDALRELVRNARNVGNNNIANNQLSIRGQVIPRYNQTYLSTEETTSLFQMDAIQDIITGQLNNLQDVPVYPSQQQIDAAVSIYIYSNQDEENNPNQRCPITMERFEVGDELYKIQYCNHIFKKNALTEWFNNNVRCPVCRYDIRDYSENNDISSNNLNNNTNVTIASPTRVYSTNVFQFEMPLLLSDRSNNNNNSDLSLNENNV